MFTNLGVNQPVNLIHLPDFGLVYIKQYGAGTLRIAADRESLEGTIAPSVIQDGIAQVTADGWKQYYWKGDLWVISDVAGYIVFMFPGAQPFIKRNIQPADFPRERGSLSTY